MIDFDPFAPKKEYKDEIRKRFHLRIYDIHVYAEMQGVAKLMGLAQNGKVIELYERIYQNAIYKK